MKWFTTINEWSDTDESDTEASCRNMLRRGVVAKRKTPFQAYPKPPTTNTMNTTSTSTNNNNNSSSRCCCKCRYGIIVAILLLTYFAIVQQQWQYEDSLFLQSSSSLRSTSTTPTTTTTTTTTTTSSTIEDHDDSNHHVEDGRTVPVQDEQNVGSSGMVEEGEYRLVQVQLVHRHGDRSPITPTVLNETELWPLPSADEEWRKSFHETYQLDFVRDTNDNNNNNNLLNLAAVARGQLTAKGAQQMMELGQTIRHSLLQQEGIDLYRVQPTSTDFPRTVQSARAFLYGLLTPTEGDPAEVVVVEPPVIALDLRHTTEMIPDPIPRPYAAMEVVEQTLMSGREFVAKEEEMKPLGVFMTEQLLNAKIIDETSLQTKIGLGIEQPQQQQQQLMLGWNNLAELCKCLQSIQQLPMTITNDDVQQILDYVAYRWFYLLRHEYMSQWAISTFVQTLITNAQFITTNNYDNRSPLYTYSAHDATLIALICAFQLDNPTKWPEYASFFQMKLYQHITTDQYYVQFSLNDEILSSSWSGGVDMKVHQKRTLVPLQDLIHGLERIQNQLPPPQS